MKKKHIKWIIICSVLLIFFIIYKYFDPYYNVFFPECIFHRLTGYKCPLCGSQRAIHYLFNFDIIKAFKENALLLIFSPYILLYIYYDLIKIKQEKQLRFRKLLFGNTAILIASGFIIVFWILRNLK